MAINFPNNPVLNELFTDSSNVEWKCIDATVGDVQWARTGFSPPQNYMGKNYIINPTFSINQRGFAGGVLPSGQYTFDRWKGGVNNDISLPDANGFITMSALVPGDVQHRVEAGIIPVGVQATLSWEGTALVGEYVSNGNAWDVTNTSPFTFTVADVDVVADVNILFGFSNGTLKNAKLEIGPVATPFEYPDLATELAKCQRYYERQIGNGGVNVASGYAQSTTEARTYFKFTTPKRITNPIINTEGLRVTSLAWGNTAMTGFTYISGQDSARLFVTVSSGLTAQEPLVIDFANTNSYIEISAEL